MLKYLLLLSALFIAGCAAWFSLVGISSLYTGAAVAAMIMTLSFEVAKLVGASFVYRYWSELNRVLKTYMLVGVVVFSCITSAGIYGYLSAAYASAASDFSGKEAEVAVMTIRQTSVNSLLQSNDARLRELQTYRTNQETRLNQLTGRVGFGTQQSIVRQAETDIRNLRQENTRLVTERDSLEVAKSRTMTQAVASSGKIGTFWYVARAMGVPLDSIVKWFTLLIVAVFDPMAVALLIGYNFLIRRGTPPSIKSIPIESIIEPVQPVESVIVPQPKEEWVPSRISRIKSMVGIDPYKDWPYYTRPDFNWDTDERWKNDEDAKHYFSKMVRVDK
jgi:hypothetical protein